MTATTQSKPIKKINIKEFREIGFLQEINRQFLHPHGLALEIQIDADTLEESLGGIWDYRDDPEGIYFAPGSMSFNKAADVAMEHFKHAATRRKLFDGATLQPVGDEA